MPERPQGEEVQSWAGELAWPRSLPGARGFPSLSLSFSICKVGIMTVGCEEAAVGSTS